MNDEHFAKLIEQSLEDIPSECKEKVENVSIIIEDWPSREQILRLRKEGIYGTLYGLYQGIPHTKRNHYGIGGPLPDKITIYKYPILQSSRTDEDVKNIVRETVVHEIGHHFGLSDAEIYKAMRGD